MNTLDCIERCILNLPFKVSGVKTWYDGTVTFKVAEYLGSACMDVSQSEIRLSISIDEDNFKNRGISISDASLIFLANELNSTVETVSFYALIEEGPCLCLNKSFTYSHQDEATKFLIQGISSLLISANAVLRIAGGFFINNKIHYSYEFITDEMNKSRFEHIVQFLPPVNILIVDDLFAPDLKYFKDCIITLLPQCKIFVATKKLNPSSMMLSLESDVRNYNIDVVIAYGTGCFFAHQINGVAKLLLNPIFYIANKLSEHIEEINDDTSGRLFDFKTHRHLAIESCKHMEDIQFMNIPHETPEYTIGFFWINAYDNPNADIFNSVYGPIRELLSEYGHITENIIRNEIIPAIAGLYNKCHLPPCYGDVTRGEFAEHLSAVINDHITCAKPEVYSERAYIKVSPYTHDITVEHGYREALLEIMDKDDLLVPDEDVIRFIALQRFPDKQVKDFLDRLFMVIDPYRIYLSHRLSDIQLVVHKDDLSMEVRIKDKAHPMPKIKTEDIYPFSRFAKKCACRRIIDVSIVKLTSIALRYIHVKGLEC